MNNNYCVDCHAEIILNAHNPEQMGQCPNCDRPTPIKELKETYERIGQKWCIQCETASIKGLGIPDV